ncbi:methylated-DNA--[protein]-cysteine S-methyltransferase [Acetobacteraceae bacterium H6797]|nr:methylated-DNA--[protein]-cysteine S-methyltransferase [Acetobacteraceae bacterium H6797]
MTLTRPAPAGSLPDDETWAALTAREARPGLLYAVVTQGVYCLFGCPSRPPLRKNTRLFADAGEAEAAGYRACQRCDPRGQRAEMQAAAVRAACRMIEEADTIPSLEALAAKAGYARHYFLRLFRDITGVTPRSYAESVRARRLSAALAQGERVADAVAGAGYGSESRVYGATGKVIGMTPGAARRGGAGEVIKAALAESVMGPLLVGATAQGVCYIGFGEEPEALWGDMARRFPKARIEEAALAEHVAKVLAFMEEPRAALDLPLDLRGTAFQRRVWEALTKIPLGSTTTYSGLAASMGQPKATRAVARACAQNPVSLMVPCHRVVGASGDLTGYRWGVPNKARLLREEAK